MAGSARQSERYYGTGNAVVRTLAHWLILTLCSSCEAQTGAAARKLIPAAWNDASAHKTLFIAVDANVRLEVLDWGGSGRPIVLLAGLGMTAHIFDGFAENLTQAGHVFGITRRGYGASSRPSSGYSEEHLAEDDLKVIESLGLTAPVVAGHSIAGNELSQLGIHHPDRVGGLIYLDALNDGGDDYTEYDELCARLPERMRTAPQPQPADRQSFAAYRAWQLRNQGVAFPESELRAEFAQTADGGVGSHQTPGFVPQAIVSGDHAHDYSQIRVPVLALLGYPESPQDQIREHHIDDSNERMVVEAVYGVYVAMARNRVRRIRAAGRGARTVDLWSANHFVFLSNPGDVLREMRSFLSSLP